MRIVADDKIPFLRGALEPYAEVLYLPAREITGEILVNADAMLVRTRTRCDLDLLRNTGISFIGSATIGFDHIDTAYCNDHNIYWTNAPGCNSSSVSQYIASALLEMAGYFGITLRDKTLGIVGVGNVGSRVAEFARNMSMRVLLNDPPRERLEGSGHFVDLPRLLEESDVITVHVPLTRTGMDKTYHLFDSDAFGRMKKDVFFINTSRGEVVDSNALGSAMDMRRCAAAVIDVWEHDRSLLSKVHIGTPHIAGYSADGKANGTAMVVRALSRHFDLPPVDWYPSDIPEPGSSVTEIDCAGRSFEECIAAAVRHTYDVMEDDSSLRKFPGAFEKLRGDYPLRREFPSYTVRTVNCNDDIRLTLKKIGFNVI